MIEELSEKQAMIETWWNPNSPVCDKDWIAIEGAIRSGKTFATIDSFINWSVMTFKQQNFIIAGATLGSLRRNVLNPMLQLLEMKGIKHTVKWDRMEVHLENGSRFYLFGAWNDMAQNALQGMTAAGFFADEVALLPRSFVEQAMGRCSVDGARYWYTLNPEGPMHWFKTEFLDRIEDLNGLQIKMSMRDNPAISDEVVRRYERQFSGVFYRRFILAEWAAAEGLVYDMFDPDVHVVHANRSLNRFKYFIVGIDYGISSTTAMGLYGVRRDDITLLKEQYHTPSRNASNMTDEDAYALYEELTEGYPIRVTYVDPSANSFRNLLRRKGVSNVRKGRNEVVDGIRHVGSKLQNNQLFIDKRCTNTLEELQNYRWDQRMTERGEDKPVKQKDHSMDQLRYVIHTHYEQPMFALSTKPRGW